MVSARQTISTRASTSDLALATRVSVYPNPATDVINITGDDIEQISVYDINERKLISSDSTTSLSIHKLAKGTYLVIVKTSNDETTHKIMKK